jgi:cysteinyl-tRNA synthetase
MSLRLHDTRARAVVPFSPVADGVVTVYLCGPTVQSPPHVGHVRSAVAFDLLHRWLLASGYRVVFARNVTDIDDKILHNAEHLGQAWWALAEQNTRAFTDAYRAVNVLPPTVEPRATGHMPEMLALIRRLMDAGHAYASGGDVYFDVRSYDRYGELSGQRVDAMVETERSESDGPKRDPLDFALWKGHKPGEPSWETPWGPGRPGWHLECSAMATKYLGTEFDIHAGGLDLVFPHHENELAQSVCAGDRFARHWLHNGLLNTSGEKMSKSVGNSLVVADVLQQVRPQVLRYYLGAPHYRSGLEYGDDGLAEAAAAYGRIETFVRNSVDALGGLGPAEARVDGREPAEVWPAFADAMNDDLSVPRALGVVHGAVRDGNGALAAGDLDRLAGVLAVLRRMLSVLALDPVAQWPGSAPDGRFEAAVDALVRLALDSRAAARSRGDFAEADRIRAALAAAGVVVEDTAAGPRWRVGGAEA